MDWNKFHQPTPVITIPSFTHGREHLLIIFHNIIDARDYNNNAKFLLKK